LSKEHQESDRKPTPAEEFGFTRQEQLFDRVSHERLLEFLDDETTTVHRVEESYNNYGEFMFIKLSRPGQERRIWMTFWGLGHHEQRERWLVDEWFFYRPNVFPGDEDETLDSTEVRQLLHDRHEMVQGYARQTTQSERGKLFEMLADMIDEDGAMAEMQDLDDLGDWLYGDGEG
jgi:hypothetical protein